MSLSWTETNFLEFIELLEFIVRLQGRAKLHNMIYWGKTVCGLYLMMLCYLKYKDIIKKV